MSNNSDRFRILIIGGGGREHALYWKLSQSPLAEAIYVMPGNAGIQDFARVKGVNPSTFSEVLRIVQQLSITMVIVGPEQFLAEGLCNYLRSQMPTLLFFGPTAEAAEIEASKAFCKRLCTKYNIPTADYRVVDDISNANLVLTLWGAPIVIKADGLCAGEGVVMADTLSEAYQAVDDMLVEKKLKEAGETIIIERKLDGRECSIMALCDGETILAMEPARDHKRLRAGPDGPDNPNTGGMGAYSPVTDVDDAMQLRIRHEILESLVQAMKAEGCPYKGVMYAGIMLTKDGPMLLEVNCRFGDPETQTIMPRLESDLLPYLAAVCNGTLGEMEPIEWSDKSSVCVNMVSGGYPGKPKTGYSIAGLNVASTFFRVQVFHAGTEVQAGTIVTAGGRVLSVVGLGITMEQARDIAYNAVATISWDGEYHREDIGR